MDVTGLCWGCLTMESYLSWVSSGCCLSLFIYSFTVSHIAAMIHLPKVGVVCRSGKYKPAIMSSVMRREAKVRQFFSIYYIKTLNPAHNNAYNCRSGRFLRSRLPGLVSLLFVTAIPTSPNNFAIVFMLESYFTILTTIIIN